MKRLVVMNGQKIIQERAGDAWMHHSTTKAEGMKPGIFNLFSAKLAEGSKSYEGVVLHKDDGKVFQAVGRKVIAHNAKSLSSDVEIGQVLRVAYTDKQASVERIEKLTKSRAVTR